MNSEATLRCSSSCEPFNTRIPSLDGLRAISILLVVLGHFTHIGAIPSALGVSIFFAISGYIITALLLRELDRTGDLDFTAFYVRRLFRLMPAVLVSIVVAAIVQEIVGLDWVTWDRVVASMFFFQNYWVDYHPFRGPLGMHWSLAVEEHFYILAPALLLFGWRCRRHSIALWLLALCGLALLLRIVTYTNMTAAGYEQQIVQDTIYLSSHLRFDSILAGVILAVLAHKAPMSQRHTLGGLLPLSLGLALMVFLRAYRPDWFLQTGKFTVQALALFLIIAAILFGERCGLFRWLLSLPPMVWLGRISFNLYLLHAQANNLAAHVLPWGPHDLRTFPFALALALAMSWASYAWIEQPMIRLGRRTSFRLPQAREA